MQQFLSMLQLQLQLFTLMGIGYFLGKRKWMTPSGRSCLTNIFIQIILPCNIIMSFQAEFTGGILRQMVLLLLLSFAIQFFCLFLSKILYRKTEQRKRVVLQYATICSNSGFMGNPVVEGIYGAQGLLYASIALIPVRIFMWSAGLSLFTVTTGRKVIRQILTHPCILAVELGLLLMFGRPELPVFLEKTLSGLGSCVTPLSMLIIGSILAEVKWTDLFNRSLLFYTLIRLVLIPAAVLGVLRFLQCEPMLTGVLTLLAGMPAGSTTAILAEKYGGDAAFASQCVFVSTIASVVTLSGFCLLL